MRHIVLLLNFAVFNISLVCEPEKVYNVYLEGVITFTYSVTCGQDKDRTYKIGC